MNKLQSLAAAALIILTVAPQAFAQSTPAAQAARLQRLQAQQAAVLARAKAAASAAAAATTVTPPPIVTRPVPTVAATAPPAVTAPKVVATAAPKTTASAATSASAAPATSGSAAPVGAPTHTDTAIALNIEALRKSRPDRRHAEFVDLQSRWGGLLTDPRASTELKLHAQRSAYLQRIRALGAKDPAFVKGVDALITKEETRDSDALNALRSGALPTTLPVATAPAAAPAAVPPAVGASK